MRNEITDEEIRESMLDAAVRNLREFGYDDCARQDLFADYVITRFLISMLEGEENCGKGRRVESVRLAILAEAKAALENLKK